MEAKKDKKMDKWIQGYACAVATMIVGHGISTPVEEVFKAGLGSIKTCIAAGVDEYDLNILKQHFK
jgi:hypothetical protein